VCRHQGQQPGPSSPADDSPQGQRQHQWEQRPGGQLQTAGGSDDVMEEAAGQPPSMQPEGLPGWARMP
jgi:hypothetical protein